MAGSSRPGSRSVMITLQPARHHHWNITMFMIYLHKRIVGHGGQDDVHRIINLVRNAPWHPLLDYRGSSTRLQ